MTRSGHPYRRNLRAPRAVLVGCLLAILEGDMCIVLAADGLPPARTLRFRGDLEGPVDLSGLTAFGDLLLVCSDETSCVQVLRPEGNDAYHIAATIEFGDESGELDLEALATDGNLIYAVGSHGLARRVVDPEKSRQQNRQRLGEIRAQTSRNHLFVFEIDSEGKLRGTPEEIDLRSILAEHPLLQPFLEIPSKENGLDIEGLAVQDGRLYVGLRGPVLRENWD